MEQVIICLSKVQIFTNLRQKILKFGQLHYAYEGNISIDWSLDNMKKTGFNGCVYDFSLDYDATDVDDILDIHKYLMKKNNIV